MEQHKAAVAAATAMKFDGESTGNLAKKQRNLTFSIPLTSESVKYKFQVVKQCIIWKYIAKLLCFIGWPDKSVTIFDDSTSVTA